MNDPVDRPFDAGLQTERTALSWQRTALSFAVASLVAARLLIEVFSILGFLVAAVGITLTCALFAAGHRRYRSNHTLLIGSKGERIPLTSATPLFAWAALAFGLGMFALFFAVFLAVAAAA